MEQPKLRMLIAAGAVDRVIAKPNGDGWAVIVSHRTLAGLHIEPLERQRGGARIFATLDAVANCLAGIGINTFSVRTSCTDEVNDGLD